MLVRDNSFKKFDEGLLLGKFELKEMDNFFFFIFY